MKSLAVNLVLPIEFISGGCGEGAEFPDRLGRQDPAVYEEQDPLCRFGLEEPVDQGDGRKCFSRSGGHGNEHGPFPFDHCRLDFPDRITLEIVKPLDINGI